MTKQSARNQRARFGGETIEPRILLSATWVTGTAGNDTLNGTTDVDWLDGLAGNDTLVGNSGDDILRGGLGDDFLNGNGGTDTADYSQATGGVQVNLLLGTARGADGKDTLSSIEIVVGSDYGDSLTGTFKSEALRGGAGDDVVYTSLGDDVLDGGTGHDTLSFEFSLTAVTVDLTRGSTQDTGNGKDQITGFEHVVGSAWNDTFAFDNARQGDAYSVDGGSGSDRIDLAKYSSSNAVVTGSSVVIDLGGGQTFRVDYTKIDAISFSDVTLNPAKLPNNAPSVDAGPDQDVTEGDSITLTGIASDPEGNPLHYQWVQVGGPAVRLTGDQTATPTFVAPEGVANYDLDFVLKVDDGTDASVDGVTIHVGADNDVPAADAAVNQSVHEGDLVALDGSASVDPEGQPLTYTWVQTGGPAVTLSDAHAAQPTFTTPSVTAATDLQFELRVGDGANTSVADTVTIHVTASDDAPIADAGVDQNVTEGDRVQLDARGSRDPEGATLTYTWVQTGGPTVQLDSTSSARPGFVAPELLRDTDLTFTVQVSDGLHTSTDSVTVHVAADDDAPTLLVGSGTTGQAGETIRLSATGTDPEGQKLTYTWTQLDGPTVKLTGADTDSPTFTAPDVAGRTTLTFAVSTSDGTNTVTEKVEVVVDANANAAPVVTLPPVVTANGNDLVAVTATAKDAEGDPLTYTWTQVGGPAVALAATNQPSLSFVAPALSRAADLTFQVAVSDGHSTTVETVTVLVTPAPESNQTGTGQDSTSTAPDTTTTTATTTTTTTTTTTVDETAGSGTAAGRETNPGATAHTTPVATTPTATETATQSSGSASGSATPTPTVAPGDGNTGSNAHVDAGADQAVHEGALVRLGATASDLDGAIHYSWTQLSGPPVGLDGAQTASPAFTAPDAANDYTLVFRVTASDGTSTVSDTVAVDVDADDAGSSTVVMAPVVADAGTQVHLAPTLPVVSGPAEPTYLWRQLEGTPVAIGDAGGRELSIRLPESFVEEELVFEVEIVAGGKRIVQEVTVQVQPVAGTSREIGDIDEADGHDHHRLDTAAELPSRGIGKVWAALFAFLGTRRRN